MLSLFTACAFFVLDVFYYFDYPSAIVASVGILIILIFSRLSSNEANISKLILPFIAFIFILLNAGWYVGGGLNTSMVLLYLLAIFASLVMVSASHRKILIIGFFVNLGLLALAELQWPNIVEVQTNDRDQLIGRDIVLVITFSVGIYLITFVKSRYEKSRSITLDQNFQLKELNDELRTLNDQLEALVQERTQKLKLQNQKLVDYAYVNFHKVRGPLATVLGLTHLLKQNAITPAEMEFIIVQLQHSAQQLDEEIKAVNDILGEESLEEGSANLS